MSVKICNGCGGQGRVYIGKDSKGNEIYKTCYPCGGSGRVEVQEKDKGK